MKKTAFLYLARPMSAEITRQNALVGDVLRKI